MELTSPTPATPAPSTEQAPAPSQAVQPQSAAQQPAPSTEQAPAQPKVNLYELPDFRNYQSARDQREAQLRAEAEQARQEAAQLRQAYVQSLPEDDREVYEQQALQQQLVATQQQLQAMQSQQIEYQKQQALQEIASEYRVPAELLAGATDWNHAEQIAKTYSQTIQAEAERIAAERADKRDRNTTFLGGGQPVTTQTLKDERYQQAMEKRDAATVLSLLFDQ